MWLRCREEHRWRYVERLLPVGPPATALAFGSAVHAGLEGWWQTQGTEHEAAIEDARERRPVSDQQRFLDYLDKPWSALEPYLQNLTNGTMTYEGSLIAQGLASFGRPEARALLEEARAPFQQALEHFHAGNQTAATELLVRASALWTHATWREFLEEEVIGTRVPGAYRPIEGGQQEAPRSQS